MAVKMPIITLLNFIFNFGSAGLQTSRTSVITIPTTATTTTTTATAATILPTSN